MRKFFLILTTLISIILMSLFFMNYNKNDISIKCLKTNNEKIINSCLEDNGFDDRSNIIESSQIKYNFHYLNAFHKFNGFHKQEIFIQSFGIALSECKNVVGCELKDDGRSYYIALNECLKNGKCIEQFINKDEKDCLKSFDLELSKIPKDFKSLITVEKFNLCQIREKSLEMTEKRGY